MSKLSDERETPRWLYERLNQAFGFSIDLAASDQNHLHDRYYMEQTNSLAQDWHGEVGFLNPPYSTTLLRAFMEKCIAAATDPARKTVIVALIPGDSSTKIAQRVMQNASAILFVNRRLCFNDPNKPENNGAKFASWIVLFSSQPDYRDIEKLRDLDLGVVWDIAAIGRSDIERISIPPYKYPMRLPLETSVEERLAA